MSTQFPKLTRSTFAGEAERCNLTSDNLPRLQFFHKRKTIDRSRCIKFEHGRGTLSMGRTALPLKQACRLTRSLRPIPVGLQHTYSYRPRPN